MRAAQEGRCAICDCERELVIDHCHVSGRVRALVCTACNNGLGWIENRAINLEVVASYLGEPCHADVLLELANRTEGAKQ